MIRTYASKEQATAVAKEALWLAFQAAGGPSGMGFLQDRKGVGSNEVWERAFNEGDYSGRRSQGLDLNADYVFGRMLKLYINRTPTTIYVPDDAPRRDYQSWCGQYKTYAALFDAAEQASKRD